jgi:hypothetical protein
MVVMFVHFVAKLSNSMEQNPSSEVNSHSASQEIPRLLWNPKAHYRVYQSPPLVRTLIQMYPIHNFPNIFRRIPSKIIFLSTPKYSERSL